VTTSQNSYGTNFRRAEEASNLTGPIRPGDDASASAMMTPFGQAGSAAAKKTGTPFGQAPKPKAPVATPFGQAGSTPATGSSIAEDIRLNEITVPESKTPVSETKETKKEMSPKEVQDLIKTYTSDVLNKMSQEEKTAERRSANNILRMEFDQYGLGSLVTDI